MTVQIFETDLMNQDFVEIPKTFITPEAAINFIRTQAWRRHMEIEEADRMVIKEVGGKGKQYDLCLNKIRLFRYDLVETLIGRPE